MIGYYAKILTQPTVFLWIATTGMVASLAAAMSQLWIVAHYLGGPATWRDIGPALLAISIGHWLSPAVFAVALYKVGRLPAWLATIAALFALGLLSYAFWFLAIDPGDWILTVPFLAAGLCLTYVSAIAFVRPWERSDTATS